MRFLVVVFALLLISVQAEEPTTLTWIGGASGSLLTESNWDPAGLPQNENWARITNSVTFTESGKDYYWRNAKLTIVGKSTVNFGARFWFPKPDSYLINKKDVLVDIEEGSSLNATYMIGGKNTATFIKTGKGSIVVGITKEDIMDIYDIRIRIEELAVKRAVENMTPEKLVELAKEAMTHAYVPYSGYKVGAALLCADGTVYLGCNIENASYSPTICAERTAMCKAVSEGYRKFTRIAIWGKGDDYTVPCGACRQFMSEFSYDMDVISAKGNGEYLSLKLYELMPHAFNTENLKD